MKSSSLNREIGLLLSLLLVIVFLTDCKKTKNPILFPFGFFPDSVVNLKDINSAYDDYNISLYQLNGTAPIIFSSNRESSGGQFDLEQASISFIFDQTNGDFGLEAIMTNDGFFDRLINKAKTPGNDFGPYRLFSSTDGYEYFLLASANDNGDLDLYYLKNRPVYMSSIPEVDGPYPAKLLNTAYDDAYISFDANQDSAFFTSSIDGNFDIYLHQRPEDMEISTWLNQPYSSSIRVDSINSSSDDKCPILFRKVMIFASNRPGGFGGFDLYYSVYRNGKWNSPVNLGPRINTASDEYRPVIGYHPDFTNLFLMFSSNRPGGLGGFDLYFTGVVLPDK